ncbi:phosphoribosyltransferase-like protein [Delftia tsuruhatensis]|uniref:phosphoribosyltransferase-like protein n=1 Tax=Delftia tsuruhatensis TaxID=180282 RepID=UPI0030D365FA
MRVDVYIKDVLARCEALKKSGMWLPEPTIRPRAWLENFDDCDKILAAQLLERFVFYNQRLTDSLLTTSFYSIADGLKKGPKAPTREHLLQALPIGVFTPVSGENPNPTDSGYFLCRRARQVLNVHEDKIKTTSEALSAAKNGNPVIFVDDFIGSGDQFLSTWKDRRNGYSFEDLHSKVGFSAIYVALVGTDIGISAIGTQAPSVAVCVTHKIDDRGTLRGIQASNPPLYDQIDSLLEKYMPRLTPHDAYMHKNQYLKYGYKHRGLFLAFEHSVPDATLPIFWCRGTNNWEPLIERT